MELEREVNLELGLAALELLPAEQGLTGGGCIFECDVPFGGTTICCGPVGEGTWCTNTRPIIP